MVSQVEEALDVSIPSSTSSSTTCTSTTTCSRFFFCLSTAARGCCSYSDVDTWVDEGGGVIGTPHIVNNGYSSDIAAMPVDTGRHGSTNATTDVTITDPSHAITLGVAFGAESSGREYAHDLKDGATQFLQHNQHDDSVAGAAWDYGSGRGVYLDFQYYTNDFDTVNDLEWGQTLMENAVRYAANCGVLAPGDCTLSGDYESVIHLEGAADPTAMTVAWDGFYYYANNGGFGSNNIYRYLEDGTLVDTTDAPFDMRSVFTKLPGTGPTYLRNYNSRDIQVETDDVTYSFDISLDGGTLGAQNRVAYDWVNGWFITQNSGTMEAWDDEGNHAGTLDFPDWSGLNETIAFSNNGCYLTFDSGSDTVYSWNLDGSAAGSATITTGDTYSFSYANGMVFAYNGSGWDGFEIGI